MYTVMLLLSVAIYGVVIFYYLRRGIASIYHPLTVYLAFHGLVFVFRPIIVEYYDYDFIYHVYQFRPALADRITVLAATNLGLLSFAYFSLRAGNVPMVFKDSEAHYIERNLMKRTMPLMLAICVPIGVFSLYKAVTTGITGDSTMILKDNIRVNTTDVGYLTDSMQVLVPICALIAWYWRFRLWALLPLVAFFLLKASSGGRGPFVVAVFAATLFYFYDRRVKLPSGRMLAIAAAVGMFFSFIGQDRGYTLRETLGFKNQTERSESDLRFLEGMDFANLEYFEFVVYVVPQRSGTYDYFVSNLQLLTEPIPRVLWPGKPAGAPIKMINFFKFGRPLGMTTSLPGNGWLQMGWIGVFLWCGLWGWATGRFYRWFVSGPQDAFAVSMYLVMFPLLLIAFRDGALLTIARQGIFLVIPVYLTFFFRSSFNVPSLDLIKLKLMRPNTRRISGEDSKKLLPRSVRKRLAEQRPAI